MVYPSLFEDMGKVIGVLESAARGALGGSVAGALMAHQMGLEVADAAMSSAVGGAAGGAVVYLIEGDPIPYGQNANRAVVAAQAHA